MTGITTTKHKSETTMKKFILIAVAIVSVTSISYAASAFHKMTERTKCEAGYKCFSCKGSGWGPDNRKCVHCKGTGANSSY